MASAPENRAQRLFFALWPTQQVRQQLSSLARSLAGKPGRRVADANLHLTLVFLGSVDPETRACIEQAAGSIKVASFTLELTRIGHWARPQVLWLGPDSIPPQLESLVDRLGMAVRECGFPLAVRPYRAHVTLARKVRRVYPDASVGESVVWAASRFCLVESVTRPEGVQYRVLREWSLD